MSKNKSNYKNTHKNQDSDYRNNNEQLLFFNSISQINLAISKLRTDLILIVSDHTVWKLYGEKFFPNIDSAKEVNKINKEVIAQMTDQEDCANSNLLEKQLEFKVKNKRFLTWIGPSGERIKSLQCYQKCVEFFLQKGIHRQAILLSIGGGAVSDFGGLVAATLMRGIKWRIITTTLLGMVDASIGGKVGINSDHGKNLLGTFYSPEETWILPAFLKTLPEVEMYSGYGEIIKYALLHPPICQQIMEHSSVDTLDLTAIIKKCASYKLSVVKKDFYDQEIRNILNLGHTFGHAFERIYPYLPMKFLPSGNFYHLLQLEKLGHLPHGIAILMGMEVILKYFREIPKSQCRTKESSVKKGQNDSSLQVFYCLCKRFNLFPLPNVKVFFSESTNIKEGKIWPIEPKKEQVSVLECLINFLVKDKKGHTNEELRIVLLPEIGRPQLVKIKKSELAIKVEEIGKSLSDESECGDKNKVKKKTIEKIKKDNIKQKPRAKDKRLSVSGKK